MTDKYASKRPERSRACVAVSGVLKRRYLTYQEALAAVERSAHPNVIPYRCPDCDRWHIGKTKETRP